MTAIRVIILCVSAAMICSAIRVQRPEIASAVSLAIGLGALMLTQGALSDVIAGVRQFAAIDAGSAAIAVKAAGITILSELGVQICTDAGESALAGRIRLAMRIVLLSLCIPLIEEIAEAVDILF